jgi:hypothetical protein
VPALKDLVCSSEVHTHVVLDSSGCNNGDTRDAQFAMMSLSSRQSANYKWRGALTYNLNNTE